MAISVCSCSAIFLETLQLHTDGRNLFYVYQLQVWHNGLGVVKNQESQEFLQLLKT